MNGTTTILIPAPGRSESWQKELVLPQPRSPTGSKTEDRETELLRVLGKLNKLPEQLNLRDSVPMLT